MLTTFLLIAISLHTSYGAEKLVRAAGPKFKYVFEAEKAVLSRSKRNAVNSRPGEPTQTHSCSSVRSVPQELRDASNIYKGVPQFYQKYTEAYDIPIISSNNVPDSTLMRACYVVRFMLADHSKVRRTLYKASGRVGIMSQYEQTTTIPEHSHLDPNFWDARARGLGATEDAPICTGAEENILCYSNDRYRVEDILLHEFAHGVHIIGARYGIQGWDARLNKVYNARRYENRRWANTYAMTNAVEMFAEATQSYFDVNAYANPPNGISNEVNTRAKLKSYDPELYELVEEVFPCQNTYIKRCQKDRAAEERQKIKMNCDQGDPQPDPEPQPPPDPEPNPDPQPDPDPKPNPDPQPPPDPEPNPDPQPDPDPQPPPDPEPNPDPQPPPDPEPSPDPEPNPDPQPNPDPEPNPNCQDYNQHCASWASIGECTRNPNYMLINCKKSCNVCSSCKDDSYNCPSWASIGECYRNPGYMHRACKLSCKKC